MQLGPSLLTAIIVAFSSRVMATEITMYDGADCMGNNHGTASGLITGECLTLGPLSMKSARYQDVPSQIQFFVSGGNHDACSNGPSQTGASGSGCITAPDG